MEAMDERDGAMDASADVVLRALRPNDAPALHVSHRKLFPLDYEPDFFLRACGAADDASEGTAPSEDLVFAIGAMEVKRNHQELVGFVTARVDTYGKRAEDEGLSLPFAWEHCIWERRRTVYILTLGVEEAFRRRGVASRLVQAVLGVAKRMHGCSVAYLHAIEYNQPAIRFYTSLGFTAVKCVRDFYEVRSGRTPFPDRSKFDALLFVLFVDEKNRQPWDTYDEDGRHSCGIFPFTQWSWLRRLFARVS
eukprot:jgi/Pico_ML_1/51388/g2433.t1